MEDKESMGIPPNSSHNNNNSSGSSTMISMSTGMQQQQSNQNHQQQTQASITPAVPVSIAPPSASSGGGGVVVSPHGHMPTVVTPANHMPTVVTAAAALGARSVTITNNEDKPSSNNNSTNSSNSNNSGGGGFGGAPPSNPTPISAAAGPNTLIHPSSGMNMGMGRGGGVMMTMGMAASGGGGGSGGSGGGTPDSLKRKRGRPRKYGPDGSMALALTPLSPQSPYSSLQKRGRGRPPGSGRKQRLAALGEWVLGSAGIGFTPHVITIAAGEISIQRCDRDGDNRLRVCYSACKSYNAACGARLDCSDRTLFSSEESGDGLCTGDGGGGPLWQQNIRNFILLGLIVTTTCFFIGAARQIWRSLFVDKGFVDLRGTYESLDSAKVQICVCDNRIYGAIGSSWTSKFLHFALVMGQTWRQVGIMFIQNFKSSKISSLQRNEDALPLLTN